MSEYWKSTPKYWCKHCSTYVRDTKLEKQNHEATGKHQGNLKRFLRDLHRGNEKDEREKQRAKDEVQRLNGVVTGVYAAVPQPVVSERKGAVPKTAPEPRQATPADRKRQLAQLAELGIAIPDEFRGEMAMAGDWQISENTTSYDLKSEHGVEATNIGVRKRRLSNPDEEVEEKVLARRKGWGSTTKAFPTKEEEERALESLLQGSSIVKESGSSNEKRISSERRESITSAVVKTEDGVLGPNIKLEEESNLESKNTPEMDQDLNHKLKKEEDSEPLPVVFKKRKIKSNRQK